MKMERNNFSPSQNTEIAISQLERTMQASIALMKRLRRQRKRFGGSAAPKKDGQEIAKSERALHLPN
ncbi:hypothetical protein [Microvirga alba]|uniref:Uncharacterized protein n=1 Tax=Microvirga alba TaxID=2791025 RepID=A0A931BNB4_9HYPH|nr:hypothetical protein [Microvirga alba]MBF9233981.1 hypothetical protein [Microvirga alba]